MKHLQFQTILQISLLLKQAKISSPILYNILKYIHPIIIKSLLSFKSKVIISGVAIKTLGFPPNSGILAYKSPIALEI